MTEANKVNDPHPAYTASVASWRRNRALLEGEDSVKKFDKVLDAHNFTNILIPFSRKMAQDQYNFFRAEAELPGVVSQFASTLINGLLRKPPSLKLPQSVPAEATEWILNKFGKDDSPLAAFLAEILAEEMPTNRAWLYIDRPHIPKPKDFTEAELAAMKPYPVIWEADKIINWRYGESVTGEVVLTMVIIRQDSSIYRPGEFHPTVIPTLLVHELAPKGYQIRRFQPDEDGDYQQVGPPVTPLKDDEPLAFIPAWPLNGSIDVIPVILTPFITKEVALYNKVSRRNHTLYGAATYTPYIRTDMTRDEFDQAISGGLGDWMKLGQDDTPGILETPFKALESMEKAIASALEEMAKLGIRMLSPEVSQSGVALELRNATQVAQLGALSGKVVATMKQAIALMINWRYPLDIKASDVDLQLSEDFSNMPLGVEWLRLVTEWYETKIIPRSLWLSIAKKNDVIPPSYDDETGRKEIIEDDVTPDDGPRIKDK